MTNQTEFSVHFTQIEDGSWLAASVSSPWFCISAETEDEARSKAEGAIAFWCEKRGSGISQNLSRTVAPFAAQHVESFRIPALCA